MQVCIKVVWGSRNARRAIIPYLIRCAGHELSLDADREEPFDQTKRWHKNRCKSLALSRLA